ncbi:MAG: hypothetical protein Q9M29_07710, partial [Mariprofundaceae bacterium]|nr:hypothetical protein [Mariprofundaceae bacterium]
MGAVHYIYGATAGETWTVEVVQPDGTVLAPPFPVLTHDGACFRIRGRAAPPVRCAANYGIRWFIRSQCKPTGTWTFNLKNNGAVFKTAYVNILPKVNEVAALQKFYEYQANYPNDAYDSICLPRTGTSPKRCGTSKATTVPHTISQKGCAISSLAMVKRYHHNSPASSSALTENSFLLGRGGFTPEGKVDWRKIPDGFMSFKYEEAVWSAPDDARLRRALCEDGPTIVAVNSVSANQVNRTRQHFVVVTGF